MILLPLLLEMALRVALLSLALALSAQLAGPSGRAIGRSPPSSSWRC